MHTLDTCYYNNKVVNTSMKSLVARDFFGPSKTRQKRPKNAKKRCFWPLLAVPDGLEPGPQKSSKITIFNNFCVLNSYDEKRISSYINVVTLRYTLYTTPFVFMITKMIKNPAYPASAQRGLWDQALHCAPKIALRCTVYVIVTS